MMATLIRYEMLCNTPSKSPGSFVKTLISLGICPESDQSHLVGILCSLGTQISCRQGWVWAAQAGLSLLGVQIILFGFDAVAHII